MHNEKILNFILTNITYIEVVLAFVIMIQMFVLHKL